jgi:hypothetical protein
MRGRIGPAEPTRITSKYATARPRLFCAGLILSKHALGQSLEPGTRICAIWDCFESGSWMATGAGKERKRRYACNSVRCCIVAVTDACAPTLLWWSCS